MTYKHEKALRKLLLEIFNGNSAPVEYTINSIDRDQEIWRKQDGTKK